jgi:hypothetical protein
MPEQWTTAQVARYLNVTPASARRQLAEWGIRPAGREAGRDGQNLYDPATVRAKHEARPGQGARTDLQRKGEQ